MILIRERKSSDIILEVYLVDFIISSNYFNLLPVVDLFKALGKYKPISEQFWKNVEKSIIQVFMHSKKF